MIFLPVQSPTYAKAMSAAQSAIERRRWPEAERTLRTVLNLKLDPNTRVIATSALAEVLLKEGNGLEAARWARRPIPGAPALARILLMESALRADFFGKSKPEPPSSVAALDKAMAQGDDRMAVRAARSVLRASLLLDKLSIDDHKKALVDLFIASARLGDRPASEAAAHARDAMRAITALTEGDDFAGRERDDIADLRAHYLPKTAPPRDAYRPGPDPFWPVAKGGLDRAASKALDDYLTLGRETGADSLLVLHRGKIVAEWYSPRYHGEPLNVASSTKSVAGLVEFLLEDERKVDFDDPVGKYLPDWNDGLRGKVKVDDLLSMTSGITHTFDMADRMGDGALADFNGYVVANMRPSEEPGRFFYANYGVQLLSPILEKVASEPVVRYARRKLFDPLGFGPGSGLMADAKGHAVLFAGAKMRAREFARLGALVLNDGVWNGHRLFPEAMFERIRVPGMVDVDHYANLWWYRARRGTPRMSLQMRGSVDNDLYVYPGSDLVVVRQQAWRWTLSKRDYIARFQPVLDRLAETLYAPKHSFRYRPATPSLFLK